HCAEPQERLRIGLLQMAQHDYSPDRWGRGWKRTGPPTGHFRAVDLLGMRIAIGQGRCRDAQSIHYMVTVLSFRYRRCSQELRNGHLCGVQYPATAPPDKASDAEIAAISDVRLLAQRTRAAGGSASTEQTFADVGGEVEGL